MSAKMENYYDKKREVLFSAKKSSTQIIITQDAWERAASIDRLQERVEHILEKDPIKQVNEDYGLKYEPKLAGWMFHTHTPKNLFALERTGNRTPGVLLFDCLVKHETK